jgi:hypothetical protein
VSHFSLDDVSSKGFSFEFRGETFKGDEVPALFWTKGMAGDLEAAVSELLGDDTERFWTLRPSLEQIEVLIEKMAKDKGSDAGKSTAPTGSRSDTDGRSTPTSDDSSA